MAMAIAIQAAIMLKMVITRLMSFSSASRLTAP
jgi:hypothetical protein